MHYDRTVLGYHGCDAAVAERLLRGEAFRPSANDYDWLGRGVYFWEFGPVRALQFANEQRLRGHVDDPAVVGAVLQLGRCFDLMDTRFTEELPRAYRQLHRLHLENSLPLPRNTHGPDRLLRRLDCAVLDLYLRHLSEAGIPYDTVRCAFSEGPVVYEGSAIRRQSHIQVAVRNPACIVGIFRPTVVR